MIDLQTTTTRKIVRVRVVQTGIQANEQPALVRVLQPSVKIIRVVQKGDPGAAAEFIAGEIPAGAVNGSNATFSSQFAFVPGSVIVFVNGLAQRRITDFNTSGQNTIILTTSPESGDSIRINYLRG